MLFCSRRGKAKYHLFVVVELLETSNGGRGGGRGWKGSRGVCREEQFENRSLYFEPANQTWFYFTKGVVLDGRNRSWSKTIIGLKRRTGR